MRTTASQVTVPFGWQLTRYPPAVRDEVRAVATAALRRLLYPIARLYIAKKYRQRAVQDMTAVKKLESLLLSALERRSVLGSCLRSANAVEKLETDGGRIGTLLCSMNYRLFLRNEFVQYCREPSNAVVFVVRGTVKRCSIVSQTRGRVSHDRRLSGQVGVAAITCDNGDDECPETSVQSLPSRGRGSMVSLDSEVLKVRRDAVLSAPAILGECSALGNFPCTEYLMAESPKVLIGWIPKNAYCAFLESFPPPVHEALLVQALETRERLLPYFAPMTSSRMRLCPLLASFSNKDIERLMEHLVPRVRPAGVQIGVQEVSRHIFFVRRGVVCLQQSGAVLPLGSAPPTQPRSRALFTEGHTFGEWQCMFSESLRNNFYTLTNVDLYLLPFSALSRLMKQNENVRQRVQGAAKVLATTAENFYEGMRFAPPSLDVLKTVILSPSHVPKMIQQGQGTAAVNNKRVTIGANSSPTLNYTFRLRDSKVERVNIPPFFIEQMRKMPLVSLCHPYDGFYMDCASAFQLMKYSGGQRIVERGSECNCVLFFCQGGAGIVEDECAVQRDGAGNILAGEWVSLSRVPQGAIIGYTCVRRHPWACSIIAPDNGAEVWELTRMNFVDILRKHKIEGRMHELVLQLLQPLSSITSRDPLLDTQPLLTPSPNSLWSEHRMPNMHPVNLSEKPRFPVWKENETIIETGPRRRLSGAA